MNRRIPDVESWRKITTNPSNNWDDPFSGEYGYKQVNWHREYDSSPSKRPHKFSPVLLVFSTVYNCEHCGAKKEDCLTDYCETKDDLNVGDWG